MTEPSPHLSIGEVLGLLQQDFPDVTISKIRFLESQGLIDPERTPSGYRKFYDLDIERLRWILHQQRENFLPLKVIKDRLENGGPLGEQPAQTEELVDVAVGAEVLDTEQSEPERAAGHPVAADAPAAPPSWQDDPTMEFDFAALSAEVAASGQLTPRSMQTPDVTPTDLSAVDEPLVEDAPIEHERPIEPAVAPEEASSESHMTAEAEPTIEAAMVDELVAPEEVEATERANEWGASNLDRALATAAPTPETTTAPDVDLVELEGGELEIDAETDADIETDDASVTDADIETDDGSVTERLRRGDLGDVDSAGLAEPSSALAATAEAETATESAEVDAAITAEAPTVRRPAVERYFSSDYSEPIGAMAMTVEELANDASLTVAQIRELERFGIIAGESVGPDVIYDEDNLAVAQAAATFLERGIEPRHLRQFAMAADREVSLYEQLALPVIRRRDPATRSEADKLLGSLYESGTELRSLLVKRGIRSTFGR